MDGFTIAFIILFLLIIGIVIYVKRNKSIDDQLDELRSTREELGEKIRAANAARDELASAVRVAQAGMEPESLIDALANYNHKYDDALHALNRFHELRDDCVDEINRGVHIQNLFLGGASDLSVIGLRKRENQYHELAKLPDKLIDTTELRIQASVLVDRMTHR